ncbi:hypothetical protein TraAM80_02771 [Trypanosoma rangeli]|uniref:Uncharacterized protein n=1 Tax=Trypanosoma rangeli TaxID=5698 RepID=A0A3R7KS10_TRYRA|nr:uncharacterized protein TraAM80_02771 [Trypanosoma rangeli]RNF08534.1 hypothetical protein TraAM80_02771 [Trypanosoma rangeli]|eukprot:RNF08534.1 hypothetical protein TraAM80_02771 [Trypanosoma rangeli]
MEVGGTITPLLQRERRELELLEMGAQLLHEDVGRGRASGRCIVSLREGNGRRGTRMTRRRFDAYETLLHMMCCAAAPSELYEGVRCFAAPALNVSAATIYWPSGTNGARSWTGVTLHSPVTTTLLVTRVKYAPLQKKWKTAQHELMHRQHVAESEL